MKKFYTIMTLLLFTFLLTGCKQNRYDDYYIVVFYTDVVNSQVSIPTLEVEKESKISAPELDLDGKPVVFEGWYKDSKFTQKFNFDDEIINESITIYVKWRYPEYKIKYVLGEGEINNDRNVEIFIPAQAGENGLRVRDPQKEGHRFRGWYLNAPYPDSDIKVDYVTLDLYEDDNEVISLYPRWDKLN